MIEIDLELIKLLIGVNRWDVTCRRLIMLHHIYQVQYNTEQYANKYGMQGRNISAKKKKKLKIYLSMLKKNWTRFSKI